MKLIGAGLPRTATLTQKVALELLGVGPCYHMQNVLGDLARLEHWTRALDGDVDWDVVFDGFDSMVDWPGSFFYRELHEAYPDAKVLLSVRSGESWVRSMRATILPFLYGDSLMYDLSSARARIDPCWQQFNETMLRMWSLSGLFPDGPGADDATIARAMEDYNARVKDEIPECLVWSPGDGWEPLCEFLEVPVPDVPLPRVNDSQGFETGMIDGLLGALNAWRQQAASPADG